MLSRVAGGLLLLGGDTADRTVYFHPLNGSWDKTRYTLPEGEQAVAATFGFADHMLWLIVQNGTTAKVIRADLTLGTSQTVADFALGEGSRPHLSVDRDGSILLARSGHDGTGLVRFVPVGSKVQAERLATVTGITIRGPLVDDSAYTFVQRNAAGTRTVRHESQLTVTSARLKCPTECGGIFP